LYALIDGMDFPYQTGKDIGYEVKMTRIEADMQILKLQVNFLFASVMLYFLLFT
jgi:hypothetical protein